MSIPQQPRVIGRPVNITQKKRALKPSEIVFKTHATVLGVPFLLNGGIFLVIHAVFRYRHTVAIKGRVYDGVNCAV